MSTKEISISTGRSVSQHGGSWLNNFLAEVSQKQSGREPGATGAGIGSPIFRKG